MLPNSATCVRFSLPLWALLLSLLPACQSPRTLRILAYNVHHCEGTDGVLDVARIARLIQEHDPDLAVLQEIDKETRRTDAVDQTQRLGGLTGMHSVFGRFMDYQGGDYGMAILSRYPIIQTENHPLPPGAEPRTALAVRVAVGEPKTEIVVVGIHLYRTQDQRMAQAEAVIAALTSQDGPVILAGDFNSTPGGPVMNRLAEEWESVPKAGSPFTFPSHDPGREIDHFLVRNLGRLRPLAARVLDEEIASDHRPILLDLEIR